MFEFELERLSSTASVMRVSRVTFSGSSLATGANATPLGLPAYSQVTSAGFYKNISLAPKFTPPSFLFPSSWGLPLPLAPLF